MNKYYIRGIQQVGVGVQNLEEAWAWYRKYFGADIVIFDDHNDAEFMLPYTGGKPAPKRALMAISIQGGGGFEVWNHEAFTPRLPDFEVKLGDLGIFSCKIKSRDVAAAHAYFKSEGLNVSGLGSDPSGAKVFWLTDPYGNCFQIGEGSGWFKKSKARTGLASGVIIGTSDIGKVLSVYTEILGYSKVVYDVTGKFDDFKYVPGGDGKFRRMLLTHPEYRNGGFGRILGPTALELVQPLGRKPKDIFKGRYWGEPGFIHVCFDIFGMDALRKTCKEKGFPFTVDSQAAQEGSSFDMGDSSGLFSYIEADKTLIEFVEGHRLPLVRGWELDLKKRHPEQPLPRWIMGALKFKRYKG
jgi:hypothetical protein